MLGHLGFWHLALPVVACGLECENNDNDNNVTASIIIRHTVAENKAPHFPPSLPLEHHHVRQMFIGNCFNGMP